MAAYDDEKKLGKIRRALLSWADCLSARKTKADPTSLPAITPAEHAAFKAAQETFRLLMKDREASIGKRIIIGLDDVPLEDLKKHAKPDA